MPARTFRGALAALLAVGGLGLAQAQTISQPVDSSGGFSADGLGQSFTATVTGTVTHIRVRQAFGPATATILLYNGAVGSGIDSDPGTPAYSQAATAIGTTWSGGAFNELALTTPFPVTAGQAYTFALGGGSRGLYSAAADLYAGGTLIQRFGTATAGFDLAFEVVQAPAAVTSFSGPSATGSGVVTASFTGGGATCSFTTSQFIPVTGHPASPPIAPPATFPHGLFDFTTSGCTPGSTITMTITYPAALDPATRYWKFGPTPGVALPHWYVLPATIVGNTATFTITDGGLGDDDLLANGTIVDQGGPGVGGAGGAVGVPTLSAWMLAVLAALLVLAAARRRPS